MNRAPGPSRARLLAAMSWCAMAFFPVPGARAEALSLENCLRETTANNPTILAARTEVERATGQRLVLRSRALATLTIGGTIGYQGAQNTEIQSQRVRQPDGTLRTVRTLSERKAQLIAVGTEDLEQPIFDAAIPASWRRGDIGVLAGKQNYYTIAVAELYQARTQFYRTLYQQERAVLLHRAIDVLTSNTRAVQALVSGGLKGRQDLLAAQVRLGNFAPSVSEAEGTYRSDLALLLQTMGRQSGTGAKDNDLLTGITLKGELDAAGIAFDAASVGQQALERRPDLQALRATVSSDREDAGITRGGYFPRIRLYVAGELIPQSFVRSNRPNAIRSSDQVQTTEIRPGVHGDWNVIDTGSVRGEAQRQDAARGEIEVNLRKLERNIPSELASVRATITDSVGTLAALDDNVEAAQNTLNIVAAGVAQGNNSQLEFLDAQNGLLTTQLGILEAKLALSIARTEFDRVTGRFMRFVEIEVPAAARSHSK